MYTMVIAERGDNNKHAHKNIIEMKQQQTWKKQMFTLELVTVITCSVNVDIKQTYFSLECATSENEKH